MQSKNKDILLLVVRLIVGGIFIASGWMKVGGHDAIAAMIGYFAQMGLPAFMVYVVGSLEIICGASIILGLWSCLASAVLAIMMVFATWYSRSLGIAGMMAPLFALAALLGLMVSGAGKFAVPSKKKADMAAM